MPWSSFKGVPLTSLHLIGFVQIVKGEGMPIFQGSGHGDLYVEYSVVFPTQLSPERRKSKASTSSLVDGV